jgi:hypothetical protein
MDVGVNRHIILMEITRKLALLKQVNMLASNLDFIILD